MKQRKLQEVESLRVTTLTDPTRIAGFDSDGDIIAKPRRQLDAVEGAGHSYLVGQYADDPSHRMFSRLVRHVRARREEISAVGSSILGCHIANTANGIQGANGWARQLQNLPRADHPSSPFDSAPLPGMSELFVIMYGLIDARAVATFNAYKDSLRTLIARVLSSAVFEDSHASCAYTGTWTTQNSTIQNSGTSYRQTTTAGDKVTITVPSWFPGGSIYVSGMHAVSSAAVDSVIGVKLDTVSQSGISRTSAGGDGGLSGAVLPWTRLFTGLAAGAHTIELTLSSGILLFDNWAMAATPAQPVVMVCNQPRLNDYSAVPSVGANVTITDTVINNLNAAIASVVGEFGSNVVVADLDAAINKNAAYIGPYDLIHLNNTGHQVAGDKLISTYENAPEVAAGCATAGGGRPVRRRTTITYAATITPNCQTSDIASVTLTGNPTIAAPFGTPTDGQQLQLRLRQDAIGGRTVTWNAVYRFAANPVLSTAANKTDYVLFQYNAIDSTWDHVPPTDLTRAPIANPVFTGTVVAPGLAVTSQLTLGTGVRSQWNGATNQWSIDNSSGTLRFFRENTDGSAGAVRMSITDGGAVGISGGFAANGVTPAAAPASPTQARVGTNPGSTALVSGSTLVQTVAVLSRVVNALQAEGLLGTGGSWSS